jgi:hypothetical protein
MDNIVITRHARERFVERTLKMGAHLPPDPEISIRKLLKRSEPDTSLPEHVRVRRLMTNELRDAAYRSCEGWRFIIVGDRLLTIERIKKHQN